MNVPGRRKLLCARGILAGAVLFTAACAPVQNTAARPVPEACTDSVYARLHRQPPDSLSEREWERLRSLDAACERSRSAGSHSGMGMMGIGGGSGRVGVILLPLVIVAMVATMLIGGF